MKPNNILSGPILASLLAIPIVSVAAPGDLHSGTVVSVIDEQTVRLARYGGGEMRVRLPEPTSAESLRDRYQGHRITVKERRWEKGLMQGEIQSVTNPS
ncbi:MAG: hypothetical protein H6981_13715 [Gammaproteobacteria bacterium]|nr:hypothetical protein [Gammaproteobacteria bacterium]